MTEEEPVKLKSHHIDRWKKYSLLNDKDHIAAGLFHDFDQRYHMVSPLEAQKMIEAIAKAIQALHEENYIDVGEAEPDIVCDNCFKSNCSAGHSVVDRITHDGKQRELLLDEAMEIAIQKNLALMYSGNAIIEIIGELISPV